MLTVSHAADAAMAVAPRRLVIRGTLFSDFFPELLKGVWDKWVAFTETSEEVRGSAVLWDLTLPDKFAGVPPGETALKREPYYWMAVQGRCVRHYTLAISRRRSRGSGLRLERAQLSRLRRCRQSTRGVRLKTSITRTLTGVRLSLCACRSTTDASVQACRDFTRDVVQFVREKNAALAGRDMGWFLNMCQGHEKPEDVFGENLTRLRKVKAKYDPKKVWSKGLVIEPLVE